MAVREGGGVVWREGCMMSCSREGSEKVCFVSTYTVQSVRDYFVEICACVAALVESSVQEANEQYCSFERGRVAGHFGPRPLTTA